MIAGPLSAQAFSGALQVEDLEAGLTTAIHFGDFGDVADFGIGAQGRLPLSVRALPDLVIMPSTGLLYYISPLPDVAGIITLTLDTAAGWTTRRLCLAL